MLLDLTRLSYFLQSQGMTEEKVHRQRVGDLIAYQLFMIDAQIDFDVALRDIVNLAMLKSVFEDEHLPDDFILEHFPVADKIIKFRQGKMRIRDFHWIDLRQLSLYLVQHPQQATRDNVLNFGLYYEFLTDATMFSVGLQDMVRVEFDTDSQEKKALSYRLEGDFIKLDVDYQLMTVQEFIDLMRLDLKAYMT